MSRLTSTLATMTAVLLGCAATPEPARAQTAPPAPAQTPAQEPQRAEGPAGADRLPAASPLDRLLFNARERTARGLALLDNDAASEALEPLRAAGRLAGGDPLSQFNAGTAELLVPAEQADPGRALPALSFAAEGASGELAAAASYNLGNAHLAAGDPAAAVEAFKSSLRANPSSRDAKFNLELALRELEKQRQQQQQQQQQQSEEPSDKNDEQNQDSESGRDPEQEPQEGRDDQEPEQDPGESGDESPEQEEERPQPDFEEQPDMSAEQAASILEAVENLEREQRRREAAEKARTASGKGKDW
ncbi:hypothetical protein [Litorivivens sp.]|uniref:hypothetical protein n=1 Tax=Litorivivens sp. TaxID=2020868 RepID=UPI003561C4B9